MATLVFDTEVYRDYFLVSFMNIETGNVRYFDMWPGQALNTKSVKAILGNNTLISFNGIRFDVPILTRAVSGGDCEELKEIANKIIEQDVRPWQLGFEPMVLDHVDLIEVAPGIASLKIYGGRLHSKKMQDLPFEPSASISSDDREMLRSYCVNDLQTTLDLYRSLEQQIELRRVMGAESKIDLRSKSDAQIAEAVIRNDVEKLRGEPVYKVEFTPGDSFRYDLPLFVAFKTEPMREVLRIIDAARFTISDKGQVKMPLEIEKLSIAIGSSVYRMGIGGLHSSEKRVAHHSDADTVLIDRDVASYYPAIILNCGLRPHQMGKHFSQVYRRIVDRRLAAKRDGNKVVADALKITINGSFGKFGSPYSRLYSPKLLIQTTLTGQLSLLMLIEWLECEGIPVVSANTDGIVIKCPRDKLAMMDEVVMLWEIETAFDTEATEYRSLYSRDVNNYIAVKPDGSAKLKGAYASPGLQKNPTNQIASEAATRFLIDSTPVEDTIRGCDDIRKFVTIRTVRGGALDQGGAYLGKAVRWYYATGVEGCLTYKTNGYTVPRSEGAKPLMELPDTFPSDVNFDWYIQESRSILSDVGGLK